MNNGYVIDDRYVCRHQLGKGGNATVFYAYDRKLDKYWAVKVCRHQSPTELEALKKIDYYAFPRIVDIVSQDNMTFLVMDYIEGKTLNEYCRERSVSNKQYLIWFGKIASALSYLHKLSPQLIYMDCKPDNIMITPSGDIRIVDLGSVYVCGRNDNIISGTRFYAPSEFHTTEEIDVTADIYSLGMTMYRILTNSNVEYRDRHGNLCPSKLNRNISPATEHIIRKCTSIKQSTRYQSMDDVAKDLKYVVKGNRPRVMLTQRLDPFLCKTFRSILQMLSAASILALSRIYSVNQANAVLGTLLISIAIFAILCKPNSFNTWETSKNICRYGINALSVAILLSCFLFLPTSSAEQDMEKASSLGKTLDISLYDEYGRKLLVRPDSCWSTDRDIFFSLDIDELSSDNNTITITCSSQNSFKKYTFNCSRQN